MHRYCWRRIEEGGRPDGGAGFMTRIRIEGISAHAALLGREAGDLLSHDLRMQRTADMAISRTLGRERPARNDSRSR
jgi:hypothetical protein